MFKFEDIVTENFNLKFLKSDMFDATRLIHLFSTRVGADTPQPLSSFTLSAKDYMQYKNYALKNQKIICDIFNSENLIIPNQQHTDKIAVIKNKDDINRINSEPFDAVITSLSNLPIMLVFADCVPVLIYDSVKNVMACIHAGWKGTAQNIVTKSVEKMQTVFNSNPSDLKAAIGPAICANCFEINSDVASKLAMSMKEDCGNIFYNTGGKIHANLKLINKCQLNEAGVAIIDICEYCTSCNNDLFYSYRAEKNCTGRHGMVAMIKE